MRYPEPCTAGLASPAAGGCLPVAPASSPFRIHLSCAALASPRSHPFRGGHTQRRTVKGLGHLSPAGDDWEGHPVSRVPCGADRAVVGPHFLPLTAQLPSPPLLRGWSHDTSQQASRLHTLQSLLSWGPTRGPHPGASSSPRYTTTQPLVWPWFPTLGFSQVLLNSLSGAISWALGADSIAYHLHRDEFSQGMSPGQWHVATRHLSKSLLPPEGSKLIWHLGKTITKGSQLLRLLKTGIFLP